jgi:hypothetical protein
MCFMYILLLCVSLYILLEESFVVDFEEEYVDVEVGVVPSEHDGLP